MENTQQQTTKMTPKDFFLNVGVIATLYVGTISWLGLIFQLINNSFPDALDSAYRGDYYTGSMRVAISTLLIVVPLFLWLSRTLRKGFAENPMKKELNIRKWLVYITLFLAGAAVAVDLIVLVNTFLEGELTIRFILKVVSVLVVALMIFSFYLSDLKKKEWTTKKWPSYIITLLVALTLIWGFFSVGSPFNQRLVRFDDRKVQNLGDIQWRIVNYWQQKGSLPTNLSDLEDSISGFSVPVDPQTGDPYTYKVKDENSFELCATFNLPNQRNDNERVVLSPAIKGEVNENWSHPEGNFCFERKIDPELYPVNPDRRI